jgi:predicted small secreted protein
MTEMRRTTPHRAALVAVALAAAVLTLAACTTAQTEKPDPEVAVAPPPPPPPPPPAPPPFDVGGRWKFTAAGGGCIMNIGNAPGAAQGTIEPAGGCPGSFYMARKWTYEHGMLIMRDHKGQSLAQLSPAGDRFEGKQTDGGKVMLSR